MALDDDNKLSAEEEAQLAGMQQAEGDDGGVVTPAAATEQMPATADDGGIEGQQQQRQQMVPHAALHEERERRKQAEERARLMEERTNLILQRFAQPQAQQPTPQQTPAPEIPPLDKDPVGFIVGNQQRQGQTLEQVTAQLEQAQTQQRQAQAIAQLQQHAWAMENEFRTTTNDYDAAVSHLRDLRNKELALAGFTTPGERQMILSQEALGLAARAIQQGRNPAEMIYELAKLRGYTPPAAVSNGQQSPAERIAQVSAGQQQGRSLGAVRGSGPPPLTAQRLLEMNDKEFSEMLKKPEGKELLGI